MKKLFAEIIGAFSIVFLGTGAMIVNAVTKGAITHAGVALTFGLIVMIMIHAIGPVSGAHMNPAVTIAFAVNKNFPWKGVPAYIISQCTGALLASLVLKFLFPSSVLLGATMPAGPVMQTFVLEIILTFFLMFVVLQVATGSKEQGMFAGITIGSVVFIEALFAGPISGASMNPARSLGPAIISGHMEHLWVYIAAPVSGALLAVIFHRLIKT
jgi:aquaporin NIP